MSILQMSLSIPCSSRNLSSVRVLTASNNLSLISRISHLSIHTVPIPATTTTIRMGGGPRTFPGGVSKWQWKRMQAKKAKQLLKARLCRERQIYEMRKRAELKASVSELERPWEIVERAPTLFSVGADEQLKALADRFQKPGGYDLWSQKDGPQIFQTVDGLPSARFFPKGVVHSVRPYGVIADSSVSSFSDTEDVKESNLLGSVIEAGYDESMKRRGNGSMKLRRFSNRRSRSGLELGYESSVIEAGSDGFMETGINDSRKLKRFSNRRSRIGSESQYEGETGNGDLVPVKDNHFGKRASYSKNLRVSSDRGKRVAETSSSGNRRQIPGDFYGVRAGQGTSHGGLRNKRYGHTTVSERSHELDSGKAKFDERGRREMPKMQNGRYNNSERKFNTVKGSRKLKDSHPKEVFEMSLQKDGSYRFQTNRHSIG